MNANKNPGDPDGLLPAVHIISEYLADALANPVPYSDPTVDVAIALSLKERLGLDETLAEAYLTRQHGVLSTGLEGMDTGLFRGLSNDKYQSVQRFAASYNFMRRPHKHAASNLPGQSRKARDNIVQRGVDWDSEAMGRYVDSVTLTRHGGMSDSPVSMGVMAFHRFNYAPEIGIVESALYSPRDNEAVGSLFSEAELKRGISSVDLTLRLRETGLIDVSPERLEARVGHSLATMQVEMGIQFLRNLEDLWMVGGVCRRIATELFARHRRNVLQDDFGAKQAMLAEVAASLEHAAHSGRVGGRQLEFIESMGIRTRAFLGHMDDARETFADTYVAFGLDVPPVLVVEEPVETDEDAEEEPGERVVAGIGNTAVEVAPEAVEPEPNPVVVAEFTERAAGLAERATRADQPYTQKPADRKKADLDGTVRTLTAPDGCRDVTGKQLLSRMNRHDAEELVAVLARLNAWGSSNPPADGQKAFTNSFNQRAAIRTEVGGLQEEIRAAAARGEVTLPGLMPVEARVNHMRSNWQLYEQVLLSIWPVQTVLATIDNIHALLFPVSPKA